MLASYSADNDQGLATDLLSFTPVEDATALDSNEHINTLRYNLSVFNRIEKNIVCLIRNNCSTNKSISTNLDIPFLGCASRRFNLAVDDILEERKGIIASIRSIMMEMRALQPTPKLPKHTRLGAMMDKKTMQSSQFEMLKRYEKIKE